MLAVLLNLADMTWAMGDLDAALAGFREAIAVIRKSSANVPDQSVGLLRSGRSTNQLDGKLRRRAKAASGMPRGSPTGWVGANESELDELRE
jgi:hypothetical protein